MSINLKTRQKNLSSAHNNFVCWYTFNCIFAYSKYILSEYNILACVLFARHNFQFLFAVLICI